MPKISRRTGTQDVSWFLDQYRLGRLDLEPSYQRRSVWTAQDRRYFLDTMFRGFPCPPVYLHKTIDAAGQSLYHVVDGKQRLETVIRFAEGNIRAPVDFGDSRLDNKRWKDIIEETELRNIFLNYTFLVEYFDDLSGNIVNEVFERMNRNSRKLTAQELRNARYEGWFSKEVESEVDEPIWKNIGIVTTGRARRMADAQFIAELFMIIVQRKIVGFDHGLIDKAFADYEDPDNPDLGFSVTEFKDQLGQARDRLDRLYQASPSIVSFLGSVSNTYVLWAVLVLNKDQISHFDDFTNRYLAFAKSVQRRAEERRAFMQEGAAASSPSTTNTTIEIEEYLDANQSATTELPQRSARLSALRKALGLEN